MASLNSLYITKQKLEEIFSVVKTKDMKGLELTISISERVNDYGQNLTAYVSQTKEEIAAKKPRYYAGNGKTFWTDGVITVAPKKDAVKGANEQPTSKETAKYETNDLPF